MRHRLPGRLVGLAAMFAVTADRLYRGFEIPIHQSERGHSTSRNLEPQGNYAVNASPCCASNLTPHGDAVAELPSAAGGSWTCHHFSECLKKRFSMFFRRLFQQLKG